MKKNIALEELAMFCFSIYLFSQTAFAWWWFPLLILTPDIGMAGFFLGPRTGAFLYNIFHHKAIAILVLLSGWFLADPVITLAGILLFGHSSMDRMFGFGLKYPDSFHHTHLGWLRPESESGIQTHDLGS
jgi:hypothetical protein